MIKKNCPAFPTICSNVHTFMNLKFLAVPSENNMTNPVNI